MEKVENSAVKEYMINYAISTLEGCKLFTDAYGKGYVKRHLDINLGKVFTNEFRQGEKAYYNTENLSITMCTDKREETILTPSDIEKDSILKGNVLHELVHAIFNKTKQECKKYEIEWGTGILEQSKRGTEIGRGLNEGLTNWICEKAGMKVKGYKRLTNLINILELGVSEKNIIKLPKGNVRKNMPKLIKMNFKRCMCILGLTDQIELLEGRADELQRICNTLVKYQTRDNLQEEDRKRIEQDYMNLEGSFIYGNILYGDPEYEERLIAEGREDTDTEKLLYIQEKMSDINAQLAQDTTEVLSTFFEEYFKDTLESEMNSGEISKQTMIMLDKLKEYSMKCEVSKEHHVLAIDYIKSIHQTVEKVYSRAIMQEAQTAVEQGQFTGEKLEELIKRYNRDRDAVPSEFISQIASMINPDEQEKVGSLLCDLFANGEISKVAQYSISNIKFGNREINAYQKCGETVTVEYNEFRKGTKEYIPSGELKSFTLGRDEKSKEIIRQFQELESSILSRYPNAQIRIINRLIVVKLEESEMYYGIDDEKILPGKEQKGKEIKVNISPDENKLPVVRNTGIFSRIVRAFRKKVYSNKGEGIVYSNENNEVSVKSKRDEFRSQISNMDNYDNSSTMGQRKTDLGNYTHEIEEEEL